MLARLSRDVDACDAALPSMLAQVTLTLTRTPNPNPSPNPSPNPHPHPHQVSTGGATEIGKIGAQVADTEAEASPLKLKLDEFGALLTKVIAAICILLWLLNINHFTDPQVS